MIATPLSKLAQAATAMALLAALSAGTANARDRALQNACFPPDALAALSGESVPLKGDHRFDGNEKPVALVPSAPIPQELRGSIRRVELPKGQKLIALTLDLCEDRGEVAGYEGRIFDYLRRENVKATLFSGGKWLRSHVARTQQLMTDPLFELANHAEAHRNLRKLDGQALSDEIAGPQRAYEGIRAGLAKTQCAAIAPEALQSVPERLSLFRFPFGACSAASLNAVNDAGLLAIQWNLSSGDPDPHMDAKAIAEQIIRHVKPGSIIIGHANGRGWHTAEALPLVIPKLKALGYQFVTVSELLAAGKPVITSTCYDSRPGDTDRYDNLSALKSKTKVPSDLPWKTSIAPATPQKHSAASKDPSHDGASSALWPF